MTVLVISSIHLSGYGLQSFVEVPNADDARVDQFRRL